MAEPATSKKLVNPVPPSQMPEWETPAEQETRESLSGKKTGSALGTPPRENTSKDEYEGVETQKDSDEDDVPRETPPDGLYPEHN